MKDAKQFAFLNFAFISTNFILLIANDSFKLYGFSFFEIFSKNQSYLLPHSNTFFIWQIIALGLITVSLIQYLIVRKEQHNPELDKKIQNNNVPAVLNQVFFGLSIVTKSNGMIGLSLLFSIGVVITLFWISFQYDVFSFPSKNIIQFLARIASGLFLGWMFYVICFNGMFVIIDHFSISEKMNFILSVVMIGITLPIVLYFTIKGNLPTLILSYATGLYGSYCAIRSSSDFVYGSTMINIYYFIFGIVLLSLIFIIYKNINYYNNLEPDEKLK